MTAPTKCVSLYTDDEAETVGDALNLGRRELDMADAREGVVLARILDEFLDLANRATCNHLPEYRHSVNGSEFCMRCRDEAVRQDDRTLAAGTVDGMGRRA